MFPLEDKLKHEAETILQVRINSTLYSCPSLTNCKVPQTEKFVIADFWNVVDGQLQPINSLESQTPIADPTQRYGMKSRSRRMEKHNNGQRWSNVYISTHLAQTVRPWAALVQGFS